MLIKLVLIVWIAYLCIGCGLTMLMLLFRLDVVDDMSGLSTFRKVKVLFLAIIVWPKAFWGR